MKSHATYQLLTGLVASLALSVTAAAQIDAPTVPTPTVSASVSAGAPAGPIVVTPGPARDLTTIGVRAPIMASPVAATVAGAAAARHRAEKDELTYMIVGGAAVVAGIVIGGRAGDVITVAGLVSGIYGLYLYLQHD
ncbi:MAG: hypothetical protein NVS1B4_19070 [Gemmatimonadaceae bacterium]